MNWTRALNSTFWVLRVELGGGAGGKITKGAQ